MKTNTSMTIYSKSVADHVEIWTRSTVDAVEWENAKIANSMASGVIEADKVVVYVPFTQGEINVKPEDYLVRGKVTDEISSQFTISDLRKKYADVVVVRSVNRLDFGSSALQHWQIGAN